MAIALAQRAMPVSRRDVGDVGLVRRDSAADQRQVGRPLHGHAEPAQDRGDPLVVDVEGQVGVDQEVIGHDASPSRDGPRARLSLRLVDVIDDRGCRDFPCGAVLRSSR